MRESVMTISKVPEESFCKASAAEPAVCTSNWFNSKTAFKEQDARAVIRRIGRENPGCKIVVPGCYAQRAPAEIASLPGVSAVVGNSHKATLAKIALREHSEKGGYEAGAFVPVSSLNAEGTAAEIFVSDIFAHTELLAAPVFDSANERTRPNLKVQDGCNNRCSFCVIPYVRGQSRSLPLSEIIREVNALVDGGYREVVISGINLGRWGRDLNARPGLPQPEAPSPKPAFEHLIRTILRETRLEKLRISSVEPMDWTDELIALVTESPRIAKHAHVPMQSGSDSVLRRM